VSVAEFAGHRPSEPDEAHSTGSYGARTPPQDNAAEQCVLGAMMLSKDAIADVVESLRGTDFYRPVHESVFDAVIDLYGRGEPADAVTVAAELQKRGELARVGGAPYLHTLVASVPVAANAGYYAEIVREKAILRRLVDAGTKIVQIGYAGEGEVDDVVDQAQAEIYGVTDKRTSDDYAPLSEIMEATLDELDSISSRGGAMSGVPTGFADLDELTNGLHPGQMVIIAARPAIGKSMISLDFARSASIRHGLASVIFSLEMGRTEITMRLLSAEARIPLNSMRNGKMTDDDWSRLARRMGEVSSAPLFIDDSPNMTMMEIRAKARRLKQRHDLRLIIVDYLQLMQSGKKVESRQLEVSEFSRQLKLLAKELDVPVVAVSQLNRGPEQRTDKRPMLSDLRESGCLTADTTLLRADTGAPITFEALLRDGHRGVAVWSLDEHRRVVPAPITAVFSSGVKEVFELALASGRTVKASANHQFLTLDGWRDLGVLTAADRIAVPRRVPAPLAAGLGWSEDRLRLLAHLIGDVSPRPPLHYTSEDQANIVHRWFGELGIAGLQSHEMLLPDALYAASDDEVRMFLRHLWATGGCVFVPGPKAAESNPRVYYATASRALADGVVHLLGRLGIAARLSVAPQQNPARPQHHVTIAGVSDATRFCAEVGVHTARGQAATAGLTQTHGETFDPDTSRALANDDVLWDQVVSITSLGQAPVFDATVKGTHNFIADGIVAHNSIEQDSDMVVLLHREDAYDRESTRPGEADLIVAKHRNGPTATITVAFQGHYSRFVDMAPG
jgi:replicative DNA helicase